MCIYMVYTVSSHTHTHTHTLTYPHTIISHNHIHTKRYPIQKIGPAKQANLEAAVNLTVNEDENTCTLGVAVTKKHTTTKVCVFGCVYVNNCRCVVHDNMLCLHTSCTHTHTLPLMQVTLLNITTTTTLFSTSTPPLDPATPFLTTITLPPNTPAHHLRLTVCDAEGRVLIVYKPKMLPEDPKVPEAASEPSAPEDIGSTDELYMTGMGMGGCFSCEGVWVFSCTNTYTETCT